MVLDPLSTFAVACNVLQVTETGVRVLMRASEYKAAVNGTLDEHTDLRNILRDLQDLGTELQSTLPQSEATHDSIPSEARLQQAIETCLRLSRDLIAILDRLQLRKRNARLDSLRKSVKSMWYKDRINALEKNLSQARDNLNIAFLIHMQYVRVTFNEPFTNG